MSLTVIATFEAVVDKRERLLALVQSLVPTVLAEPGCIKYDPHTVGANKVVLIESWESMDSLKVHSATASFAAFKGAIVELLVGEPEIVLARPAPADAAEMSGSTGK